MAENKSCLLLSEISKHGPPDRQTSQDKHGFLLLSHIHTASIFVSTGGARHGCAGDPAFSKMLHEPKRIELYTLSWRPWTSYKYSFNILLTYLANFKHIFNVFLTYLAYFEHAFNALGAGAHGPVWSPRGPTGFHGAWPGPGSGKLGPMSS